MPRRRGRPPLDPGQREALILDALEKLVATKGLKAATMDAVARAAGMSKRTLYAIHDSRAALFTAWVRRVRASLVRPLPAEAHDLPLKERLHLLLRREVRARISERRLAVLRAMIAEAPEAQQVAQAFLREGAGTARAMIAEELARAMARGEIVPLDPQAASEVLFDMVYHNPLDWLLDSQRPPLDAEQAEARLGLAIGLFLDGARVRRQESLAVGN
ncbi:TetR/AcrR family transcriptional regulator [Roseospirillum parvum]|nr:TetR/AcrR family transcriptional regulator [Roseospirillum parvum]